MAWRPASIDEVKRIAESELSACSAAQRELYESYAIAPRYAPITRYGQQESVVIVAKNGNDVVYWEDVEEGFNVSPLAPEGNILEHWCNQDSLGVALENLQKDEARRINFGQAQS